MKKRRVLEGEVHHIYQRTIGGGVLFYSVIDYLVYFTIVCTVADQLGITVLALCPMPDHLHQASRIRSRDELSRYVQRYTHLFAQEWNKSRGRKGPLFRARFGSAVKVGNKAVRNTLAYNNNNPVERKMVKRAEDYRWNFLRYAQSSHPYSSPLQLETASKKLRRVLQEVRQHHQNGEWIRYRQWDRWIRDLTDPEIRQLTDYIITTWNVIDYHQAASYYGDFDTMVRAFHDNTGSEYDIPEDRDQYSDAVYTECIRLLIKEKRITRVRGIPLLPREEKVALMQLLQQRTTASHRQILRLLHWHLNN